jgi:soluble lytic murein transglycosylase-like protein
MRQAQQGYGNRAVQRWLAAHAQVQREPPAAPEAPAPVPQDTSTKKAGLTFDEVKQLITANNKSTVSTELLTCLIWKESGFDPNVKSKSSSATGLMQMTKGAVEQVNKSTPKGIHFEHSEMTDSAKNIDCGSRYLQIRIDWAKGDVTAGLNGYGTGAGYADSILTCEACLTKAPTDPTPCLTAIHP